MTTNQNNAAQPLLTDEEIQDIADGFDIYGAKPEFARAIESALLSKLRAPVADERVAGYVPFHDQPQQTGVGEWCAPGPAAEQRQTWLLRFADTDRDDCVYYDEQEARRAFAQAEGRGWNCYLFEYARRAALASAPVAGEAHQEEWRPVVGFEGCYEASSLGAVRSISSGRILSRNALAGDGYVKTDLHRGGVRTHGYLHRIVAEAFHGPAEGREVNHKNGDKLDNRAANLEWVTRAENEMHSRYVLGNLCSRVIAIHTKTGERIEFPSHAQAERELGINKDTVRRCLVGELKQTKGWRFERPAPQASTVAGEADNTDYIGLALELESAAKRVESQTVQRAMEAGAHGLRLAHSFRNAAPQASAMPRLNDAMRAVIENRGDIYHSPDTLYEALCRAAGAAPQASEAVRDARAEGFLAGLDQALEVLEHDDFATRLQSAQVIRTLKSQSDALSAQPGAQKEQSDA
ncbi:NUMOD4 motif-containing HNH endonuclease [Achromobacter mucicolens]|uniref:NUMOD4 motif-containing HNH endonuclease n=1 Tax=Achromobacter mucicolens TaxID=1389922 RepID=UPI002FDFDC16